MPFDFRPGQPDERDTVRHALGTLFLMALMGIGVMLLILLIAPLFI